MFIVYKRLTGSGVRNSVVVTLALVIDIVLSEKKYVGLRQKIESYSVVTLHKVMDPAEAMYRKVFPL